MRLPKWSSMLASTGVAKRIEHTMEGVSQLAIHEAEFLDRHLLALKERMRVARRARGVGELLRNQLDLLPATTARLANDHRVRRRLWRELGSRLK